MNLFFEDENQEYKVEEGILWFNIKAETHKLNRMAVRE